MVVSITLDELVETEGGGMKEKLQAGAELLAPPSAHELAPPSAAVTIGHNRKKPHMLPPIADRRVASMELAMQRGSPPPSWRRPSVDEMLQGGADRPAVCVSRCPEVPQDEAKSTTLGPNKYAPLDPIKKKTKTAP
ncbi:uncharacterized protein LOC132204118 isoform X2 [Neocloeon triangulifer]|uniref:uncharacterized protein LOC132204118 isoform X2 n=1 Tax=Neocloeon triangulifer TaxID=2078957 RepID=UPI00286EF38B|nr:uncharacterized protein LOC132204118 isoform X2 [Neocloeon triangulifer]